MNSQRWLNPGFCRRAGPTPGFYRKPFCFVGCLTAQNPNASWVAVAKIVANCCFQLSWGHWGRVSLLKQSLKIPAKYSWMGAGCWKKGNHVPQSTEWCCNMTQHFLGLGNTQRPRKWGSSSMWEGEVHGRSVHIFQPSSKHLWTASERSSQPQENSGEAPHAPHCTELKEHRDCGEQAQACLKALLPNPNQTTATYSPPLQCWMECWVVIHCTHQDKMLRNLDAIQVPAAFKELMVFPIGCLLQPNTGGTPDLPRLPLHHCPAPARSLHSSGRPSTGYLQSLHQYPTAGE